MQFKSNKTDSQLQYVSIRNRSLLRRHHPNVSVVYIPICSARKAHLHSNRTPHYPGEDDKLRASSISRRRGGNCCNTLEVLQQLRGDSSTSLNLVTVLPAEESMASRQIQTAFQPRVRLDRCIYREAFTEPASSYIIKSQESGSRTIVNYNELPEMSVEELTGVIDEVGASTTWFHFEVGVYSLFSWRLPLTGSRAGYLTSSWRESSIFVNGFPLCGLVLRLKSRSGQDCRSWLSRLMWCFIPRAGHW